MASPLAVQILRSQLWQQGYRPVPVETNGKKPVGVDWPGKARRTPPVAATATATLDALNTGILCDGLVVVDVDVDEPAVAIEVERIAIEMLGNALVRRRANSPRVALMYRAQHGEPAKRTLVGTTSKIEILGRGQQLVVDGIHESGFPYTWQYSPTANHLDTLRPVLDEAITAFLTHCAGLIGADASKIRSVAPGAKTAPPTAVISQSQHASDRDKAFAAKALRENSQELRDTSSGRNAKLNAIAYRMGRFVGAGHIEAAEVERALMQAATENGYLAKRGYNMAQKTLKSGLNSGMNQPVESTPDLPNVVTDETVQALIVTEKQRHETKGAKQQTPKLEMQQTERIMKPAWPKQMDWNKAYPGGFLYDYLNTVMPHTEADPNALVLCLLTACGASVGRGAYFQIGRTRHYPNLFTNLVGKTSGGRKGTAMSEIREVMRLIDPTLDSRMMNGLSTGEGLIDRIRDAREDDIRNKDGSVFRGLVDTGVDDKRLLVMESELAQPLQAMKREGNTLSAILRQIWDGSPLQVMAKSNKSVCKEPHGAIIGGITPEELLTLFSKNDRANGLGNRFLFCCTQRFNLMPHGGDVDPLRFYSVATQAANAISRIRNCGRVNWTHAAAAQWEEVYKTLTLDRAGFIGDLTARAEAQVTRIALIYALLDGTNFMDTRHLTAALEVWRYCEDSVRYIFGDVSGNSDADRIFNALSSQSVGMSQTEISRHIFSGNRTADQLASAIFTLQSCGRVRGEACKTIENRTETRYFVNS